MAAPELPVNPKRAVVAREIYCRSCRYNLRGLRLESDCPECGLSVQATIIAEIDPTASDLPRVRSPRAVGNGLVLLMLVLFLIAFLLGARAGVRAIDFTPGHAAVRLVNSPVTSLLITVLAVSGLLSCVLFASSGEASRKGGPRQYVRPVAFGLIAIACVGQIDLYVEWALSDVTQRSSGLSFDRLIIIPAYVLGGLLALAGGGGVLRSIGERSRVYREAKGGRQSIAAMNIALVCIALAAVGTLLGDEFRLSWLRLTCNMVIIASGLMVVIGLGYLVVNAWWIRTALRKSPPRLRDLVRIEVDSTSISSRPSGEGTADDLMKGRD